MMPTPRYIEPPVGAVGRAGSMVAMPSRISLRERRLRAKGLSPRLAKLWTGRYFADTNKRAKLTTALTGANNDLSFYAKSPGTGGNSITVAYVASGNNTPLSVTVTGSAISVALATGGAGAITSTAADVRKAINFSRTASPLVHAQSAPGNDGTGVVTALAATALSGGAAGG